MKMKYTVHILIVFFGLVAGGLYSQDQLFFRKGTSIACKIVAISEKTITYRDTIQGAPLITVPKGEVILAEYKTGEVYIFSAENPLVPPPEVMETRDQRKERKMKEWKVKEQELSDNILGFYIPDLFFGRFTVSYERLLANKSVGVTIPLSLTYDFLGALAEVSSNSSSANTGTTVSSPVNRTKGVNFITGIDVNYYYDLKPELKYFFGPRIRYGTDQTMGGIEGLSFQLQNGLFRSRGKKMTSTIGIGFGFVKILSFGTPTARDPKQVYPWGSFTWRLGFRL
jgi:hypothetical protein